MEVRILACRLASLLAVLLGAAVPTSAQEAPSEQELIEQVQGLREALGSKDAPTGQQPIGRTQGLREAPGSEDEPAAPEPLDQAAVAEMREQLAQELGVEVLDVQPFEADGRPAYAVKVMTPGGNFNDAFLVSTLVVDRESGQVLGRLQRSIETAADFPDSGARFQPNIDGSSLTIRRRTYR